MSYFFRSVIWIFAISLAMFWVTLNVVSVPTVTAQYNPPAGPKGATGATGPICGSTTQAIVNLSGSCVGTYYPNPIFGSFDMASATASGTTNYIAPYISGIALASAAVAAKYLMLDRACNVKRWAIYSDVGPGGTPTSATVTLSLVAYQFTPGTGSAFSATSYAGIDADASTSASGTTPVDAVITTFTANPLTIPANSYVGIEAVTSGGVATTNQMNFGSLLLCE